MEYFRRRAFSAERGVGKLHYLDRGGEAAGGGGEGGGGKGAAFTCDAFCVYFRPGEKRGGRGERDQTHVRDMRFHLRPLIARLGVVPTNFKEVEGELPDSKVSIIRFDSNPKLVLVV